MSEVQAEVGAPPTPETAPETESSDKLFDPTKEFGIHLRSGPDVKVCRLRFPTDEDWIIRSRKVRVISRNHGRGRSSLDSEGVEEANLALFKSLTTLHDEGDSTFDEYEASEAIDMLTVADKLDVEQAADAYRIELAVAGGLETTHLLRIPTVKQRRKFEQASSTSFTLAGGHSEFKANLAVVGTYYDELASKSWGYAPGAAVPLIHKVAVVNVLSDELSQLEATVDPLG